jgi:transketolase
MDGHDMADIVGTLDVAVRGADGRPTAVIAHTVKGKGVSFMEGRYFWHTRAIKPEELAQALAELGEPAPDGEGASR